MAVKRSGGLGRGLDALFSDSSIAEEVAAEIDEPEAGTDDPVGNGIRYIKIDDIKPNVSQPRKNFDERAIDDLAESIKLHGLIQPIIVRPSGASYEIVAGERRWRAAKKAELKTLPCIVRELSDRENMLLAIIENTQREDLNPVEEALAFEAMIKHYELTQEEVSKSVGKSRPYITNALRLLKLPDEVRQMLIDGHLTGGHARAIAGIEDEATQIKLAKLAADGGLSVRALEQMIAETTEKQRKNIKPTKKYKSPEIISAENELKQILGTKVSLPPTTGKGKIEISFYSQDELERILEMLMSLRNL